MIAPLRQPPIKPRRRTALSAARQAVVEALLDGEDQASRRRLSLSPWQVWSAIGVFVVGSTLYLLWAWG
jgi:hypothetical protein